MAQIFDLQNQSIPDTCYVFKHSTRCPVSFAAANEIRAAELPLDLYWVNVVEQRPLSSWIAEHYKTPHQSPQLLHVVDGVVAKVWNHGSIRRNIFS